MTTANRTSFVVVLFGKDRLAFSGTFSCGLSFLYDILLARTRATHGNSNNEWGCNCSFPDSYANMVQAVILQKGNSSSVYSYVLPKG